MPTRDVLGNDHLSSSTCDALGTGKVKELTVVKGLKRESVEEAQSGDLVSVSIGGFQPRWTQTLSTNPKTEPIQCARIDPPVISINGIWVSLLRRGVAEKALSERNALTFSQTILGADLWAPWGEVEDVRLGARRRGGCRD